MAGDRRLPGRFPIGTRIASRYVVEDIPAKEEQEQGLSRPIVLPSGERLDLTGENLDSAPRRAARRTYAPRRTRH